MAQVVNRIRNPDFARGKSAPTGWKFTAKSKRVSFAAPATGCEGSGGVTISSQRAPATACFSQEVKCKPGEYYRVEATCICDLQAADDTAGLVVSVQGLSNGRRTGGLLVTPGVHRAAEPVAIRAVYEAPEGIRDARVSVGISEARGSATITHVRFIKIIEPEEESHILSITPISSEYHSTREARSVCVCSMTAETRPITKLLRGYFGDRQVTTLAPQAFKADDSLADALLLPDATAPPAIRSLVSLMKLAKRRTVMISLPAFAKLTNAMLSVRRIEQDDDPMNARVVCSNHATHPFALHDAFPYAWPGEQPGSFVQNQFRRSPAAKSFLAKHGLETLLHSLCDQEVTSDRPVALYKAFQGGELFVVDIEPAESPCSTRNEPALAMHFLLSACGVVQGGLGTYVVPAESEEEFRTHIRDMGDRFEQFVVHEADLPVEEVTEQLVTIGREDKTFGLPLKAKPVILIRSGLRSGDMESVYGAFVWIKQLIRMAPDACPYADELAGQYRFAWVPSAACWEAPDGWRRTAAPPEYPVVLDLEESKIAAMIDIVSVPANRTSVLFPAESDAYQHCRRWLPQLAATFPPGIYYRPEVDDGRGFTNRDEYSWRRVRHQPRVSIDPDYFQDQAHRDVIQSGGQAICLEVPGSSADFVAASIHRTDLVATLLEHVIGLQYGLVAVNRGRTSVQLDALAPIKPGGRLIVHREDTTLLGRASHAI